MRDRRARGPGNRRLTGDVNEAIGLEPHETRTLQGSFDFDAAAFGPAMPLSWNVLYRDAAGFVLQTRITGQPSVAVSRVHARNRN